MRNPFNIVREIGSSQSKGCWFFIQVGCSALVMRQLWGKPRGAAIVHAEIDTPYQRLRVTVWGKQKKPLTKITLQPNNRPGNSYRDRWLRKLGYI